MASVSKRKRLESPEPVDPTGLLAMDRDTFAYMLQFLRGRPLARLARVCKHIRDNDTLETVARSQMLKVVPGFAHLPESLLQQHIQRTDMMSSRWAYLYHLTRCYPTTQEINRRQRYGSPRRTDWNDASHRWYFIEKVFGKSNVVFLVNSLRFMKKYKVWSICFEDEGVPLFMGRFLNYGGLLAEHRFNFDWPSKASVKFRLETQLYLLQHHRDLLVLGDGYGAVLHTLLKRADGYGFTDLSERFKALGAVTNPDSKTALEWRRLLRKADDILL